MSDYAEMAEQARQHKIKPRMRWRGGCWQTTGYQGQALTPETGAAILGAHIGAASRVASRRISMPWPALITAAATVVVVLLAWASSGAAP